MRNHPGITILVALLAVILAVMWATCKLNDRLPHWAQCPWCEPASVTLSSEADGISGALPSDAVPSATADSGAKDCLPVKDAWALAERQTLERLHELLRKRGIRGKAAEEIEAYVKANPFGTGKTGPDKELSFTGVSVAVWNTTFKDGVRFGWSDERKLCICHIWGRLVFAMPPPPKRPAPPILPRPQGCVRVRALVPAGTERTFRFTLVRHAAVPNFNCWGYIDNAKRVGSPHDCDWCQWAYKLVTDMEARYPGRFDFFHTSVVQVSKDTDASGQNEDTWVTLVLPPEAIEGGVGVCVEVDGVVLNSDLVLPSDWHGNTFEIRRNFFVGQMTRRAQ